VNLKKSCSKRGKQQYN